MEEPLIHDQEPKQNPHQLESRFSRRVQTLGYPFQKRYNVDFLEDLVIAYTCGNFLHIKNIQYEEPLITIAGHQEGVGGFAVHPDRSFIAVGEKGDHPNVYIYSYPELEEKYILRGGTEKAYVDLDFDKTGTYLATLGAAPDYMLTVWNWQEEKILLRCKAFSQDVWGVRFSKHRTGVLTTYGMGHIRFWLMASTFTGSKLMGEIGKFNREELSDVSAFCELPSGRILSGSECGRILVWDGEFCIFPILLKDGSPPHDGMIEHISLRNNGKTMVTAGRDGFVRTWDASELEFIEVDEGCAHKMQPLQEYQITNKTSIVGLYNGAKTSLVQDAQGVLWSFDMKTFDCEEVLECPSGAISDVLLPSGDFYEAITVDKGGSVFSWNLGIENGSSETPEQNFYRVFSSGISQSIKLSQKFLLLCFEDGIVRVAERFNNGFGVRAAVHVHSSAIVCAKHSDRMLATACHDSTVFISQLNEDFDDITPNYFFRVPSPPTHMFWAPDNSKLHCVIDKRIISFSLQADVNTEESFEVKIDSTEWTFQPPEPRCESTENLPPGQDPQPLEVDAIDAFLHIGGVDFYCTVRGGGWDLHMFKCSLSSNRVLETVPLSSTNAITSISTANESLLLIGDASGQIQVRDLDDPKRFLLIDVHEAPVTAMQVTFDSKILVSGAQDGTLFSTAIDFKGAVEAAESCATTVAENLRVKAGAAAVEELEECPEGMCDDDEPLEAYSFEEVKQRSKDDQERAKRDHKRKKLEEDMQTLRKQFKRLIQKNSKLEADDLAIPREELDLDPEFREKHAEKLQAKIEESRKELQPVKDYHQKGVENLRERFFGELECEDVIVSALGDSATVNSFRTSRLPAHLLDALSIIENEVGENSGGRGKKGGKGGVRSKSSRRLKMEEGKLQAHEKRAIREALQAEKEEMDQEKPDENEDDPQDVAAMELAEATQGDFVLKTSDEYKVPENKRVDVKRNQKNVILLFKKKYDMKMGLNNALLALRNEKKQILKQCEADIAKLNEIDEKLGKGTRIQKLEPHDKEYPEKRWEFVHKDLIDFELQVRQEKRLAEKEAKAKLNAYGGDEDENSTSTASSNNQKDDARKKMTSRQMSRLESTIDPVRDYSFKMEEVEPTLLQQKTTAKSQQLLQYERSEILRQMNARIRSFDSKLFALRVERANVAVELKSMDLAELRMMQELEILEDFESKGEKLKTRLEESRNSKTKVILELARCRRDSETALVALKGWEEKDVRLMKEFNSCVIGKSNPYFPILRKIFLRKIKRKAEGESDADSDFDDDFDLSDDSDSDFEELCPEGCEQSMYNKVLELRERRLDLEESLDAQRKRVDELKAINKNLLGREKNITKNLAETEEEINRFEFDKQSRFNELCTCLPLHTKQFLFQEEEAASLPDDLSNLIVFDYTVLKHLESRTAELIDEQTKAQTQFTDLQKAHRQLKQKYKQVQTSVSLERARCEEVQLLKFGKLVPLELLDQAAETEEVQAAKSEARKIEKQCERSQGSWGNKLKQLKEEIYQVEVENTRKLEALAAIEAGFYSNRREMKKLQGKSSGSRKGEH